MYDIPKVRYQGKLIQYANYSMSRNDIDRHCIKEYKLERCRVTFGGYEFPMNTYDNPVLRMIQLYLIPSEMEQCIGRSRLLRTDAVVYLFSNFPCEQTEIRFDDYLKEKYASVPEGTPAIEK